MPNDLRKLVWLALALLPLRAAAQAAPADSSAALTVEEIRCAGNESTACDFIREHLYLRAGDKLDEEEVRNASLRLSALRNFDRVDIRLEKGAERGNVVVLISVHEADPIALEWMAGVSSRLDSQRAVVGTRIADQNLFGRGKLADFSVLAAMPFAGDAHYESYDITARYADPQLFDSRRWFGIAEASYHKRDTEDVHGNYSHLDTPQLDLGVGHRLGDFAWLTISISWRPGDWTRGRWKSDGSFLVSNPDYDLTTNLVFGWSNEDDLYFPTRGSAFQVAVGGSYGADSPNRQPHVQLRKTWQALDSYWTFKLGGDPSPEYRNAFDESQLVTLTFSRPLRGAGIRRARWYVEPGFGVSDALTAHGDHVYEVGVKAGYRADTRTFGIVNFYLIGTVDPHR